MTCFELEKQNIFHSDPFDLDIRYLCQLPLDKPSMVVALINDTALSFASPDN